MVLRNWNIGYDSAGLAVIQNNQIHFKTVVKVRVKNFYPRKIREYIELVMHGGQHMECQV